MISYYSNLNKQSINKIKEKCFFSFKYVNKNLEKNSHVKSDIEIKNNYLNNLSKDV